MAQTIWGTTQKPASSRRLVELLQDSPAVDGTLYIGYPVLGTPEGALPFDALLLSPTKGLVAFDIAEGRDIEGYQERQDNLYANLNAKLLQYPALVRRRSLLPKITTATFAPARSNPVSFDEEYPILDEKNLLSFLLAIEWTAKETFPVLSAAIQALSNVRKGKRKRASLDETSRGAKLQRLNESIANLDSDQSAAVVETVDGVQRIRGLAGSGKTIVLALKVAYLHARHPDWRIAVTFNTRSLKGQFERLINTFVIEQTNEEPDWSQIHILHSWGAPSAPGIYYNFVRDHAIPYRDFRSAREAFGDAREFDGACAEALALVVQSAPKYDAILVDEAQDLPRSFLRICYKYASDPRRIVYAYDELQNLTNTSVPGPEELFGEDEKGRPLVVFESHQPGRPRQDIILERCYRNSRPILVTAHALGFGIYRESGGLLQMFDQRELWQDVGYRVRAGNLNDGQFVSLERTDETSPRFLEEHSPIADLVQFRSFATLEEQDEWLVNAIVENIERDDLVPDDIVVINPEPIKTRKAVAKARSALFAKGINNSLAGVSGSPDVFFEQDVVTFTGIFRAKGNEAAMVYIINAQDCYGAFPPVLLARARNRLFTAITRSKAWVRILGVGPLMNELCDEYSRVMEHNFCLDFVYPDEQRRRELRIINRDMTAAERDRVSRKVSELSSVLEALERGEVQREDLPEDVKRRLRAILD